MCVDEKLVGICIPRSLHFDIVHLLLDLLIELMCTRHQLFVSIAVFDTTLDLAVQYHELLALGRLLTHLLGLLHLELVERLRRVILCHGGPFTQISWRHVSLAVTGSLVLRTLRIASTARLALVLVAPPRQLPQVLQLGPVTDRRLDLALLQLDDGLWSRMFVNSH